MSDTNPQIVIHDLSFHPFISAGKIQARVAEMGREITRVYAGQRPLFLGILNGAFVFTADLVRACELDCEVAFLRLSSYSGLSSTGKVDMLLGLDVDIRNRPVIVVEDIIDTGRTMSGLLRDLAAREPSSLAVASLLFKREANEHWVDIDFLGFEIPNKFVVGYGLDYDGVGRNLPAIFQLS